MSPSLRPLAGSIWPPCPVLQGFIAQEIGFQMVIQSFWPIYPNPLVHGEAFSPGKDPKPASRRSRILASTPLRTAKLSLELAKLYLKLLYFHQNHQVIKVCNTKCSGKYAKIG